jgi:hypothetical protein
MSQLLISNNNRRKVHTPFKLLPNYQSASQITNCVNIPLPPKLSNNVNVPHNDKNTLHKIIKILLKLYIKIKKI